MMKLLIISILSLWYSSSCGFCQSLENLGKRDMIKTGGGLSYSSIFYNANGIPDRRDPHIWFLSGNVTTSVLGISLPFTFNFSNNQTSYSQPYMLQSLNPSYKWIKGFVGITSMNFSQYTLAGHIFSGAGIELTPKNYKISIMYGRLKKAVEFDIENNSDLYMSYKRMGFGMMTGYEKKGNAVKLIFFTAKDEINSLTFIPINTMITPKQNAVISIIGKTTLYKKITFQSEYALSGLTKNLSISSDAGEPIKNMLPYVYKPLSTSQFFDAFKSSVGYNNKAFSCNINYERVAPQYQTLGAYFFNNDLENITIAPSLNLLKGKLSFACNTGIQRNNLDNSKLNTNKRWVGSINTNYAPNNHWTISSSLTNFSSFTKQRPQTDPFTQNHIDTMNFYQVSQSAMLNATHNFGNTYKRHNISFSLNHQISSQEQGDFSTPGMLGSNINFSSPVKIFNSNLAYTLSFTKIKTSFNSSFNINSSDYMELNTIYLGPNLNLSRSVLKNTLRVTLGSSYNQVLKNSHKMNEVLNHIFAANYSPKFLNTKIGKVNINLSISYLQKLKSTPSKLDYSEFTGNFGINYTI